MTGNDYVKRNIYYPQFHIHDTQDDIVYTKAIIWKVPILINELSGNVVRKGEIASFELLDVYTSAWKSGPSDVWECLILPLSHPFQGTWEQSKVRDSCGQPTYFKMMKESMFACEGANVRHAQTDEGENVRHVKKTKRRMSAIRLTMHGLLCYLLSLYY